MPDLKSALFPAANSASTAAAARHVLRVHCCADEQYSCGDGRLARLTRNQFIMNIYLIDGTYELFRHYFAVPSSKDVNGQEIGAVRGVLFSVLSMIEAGTTHLGVAT